MYATRRLALIAALVLIGHSAADEPKAPPSAEKIMLWAWKNISKDCALKTEVTLNGKKLGVFDSETQRDISDEIKVGTNTIVFATTPQEPASSDAHLDFDIGPVTTNPKTKKNIMRPTLMHYRNSIDWKLDEDTGKFTHPFGPNPKTPDRKTVTHTYTFEYVGSAAEKNDSKEGAYVLQVHSILSYNPSVVGTVTLNGKPLGSFLGREREVDVTRLLKAGENEIKLTTDAIANQLFDNDITFQVLGPLSYNVPKERFVGKQVIQFKAMEGWTRDRSTGVMHVKGSPGKTTHERTIRFNLDEAPK